MTQSCGDVKSRPWLTHVRLGGVGPREGLLSEVPLENGLIFQEGADRYRIDRSGVAIKSRCATGIANNFYYQ